MISVELLAGAVFGIVITLSLVALVLLINKK